MLQQTAFANEQELSAQQSYQPAFPVSPTALQDAVAHLVMSVICGQSYVASFAKLGPNGSWEKMSGGFFQAKMDGFSEEFSGTWPGWGILSDGVVSRLHGLEPPIGEREYLLLPTPNASDHKCFMRDMPSLKRYLASGHQKKLILILLQKGFTDSQIVSAYERVMGFPLGWTELKPSETP